MKALIILKTTVFIDCYSNHGFPSIISLQLPQLQLHPSRKRDFKTKNKAAKKQPWTLRSNQTSLFKVWTIPFWMVLLWNRISFRSFLPSIWRSHPREEGMPPTQRRTLETWGCIPKMLTSQRPQCKNLSISTMTVTHTPSSSLQFPGFQALCGLPPTETSGGCSASGTKHILLNKGRHYLSTGDFIHKPHH